MKLDRLMEVANEGYGDVDDTILSYYRQPDMDFGDTLAKFVVVELQDTYVRTDTTAQQLSEAIRVMTRARDEIQGVIDCLEAEAGCFGAGFLLTKT